MEINIPTMPDEAVSFTRLFNGLNGEELQAHILTRLKNVLENDTRLGSHISHGIVSWRLKLDIVTQPAEEDHKSIDLRGGYVVVDKETGEWKALESGVEPEWPKCIFIPVEVSSGLITRPDKIREEIGADIPVVKKRKDMPRDEGAYRKVDVGIDQAMKDAIEKHKPKNVGAKVENSPLVEYRSRENMGLKDRVLDKMDEVTKEDRLKDWAIEKEMSEVARERLQEAPPEDAKMLELAEKAMQEALDKAPKQKEPKPFNPEAKADLVEVAKEAHKAVEEEYKKNSVIELSGTPEEVMEQVEESLKPAKKEKKGKDEKLKTIEEMLG